MCDQSQVRHGVMLLLLRDRRGHGKSNDHFLWPETLGGGGGVKGRSQQLPACETWSADVQPGTQLNSIKTKRDTGRDRKKACCLPEHEATALIWSPDNLGSEPAVLWALDNVHLLAVQMVSGTSAMLRTTVSLLFSLLQKLIYHGRELHARH